MTKEIRLGKNQIEILKYLKNGEKEFSKLWQDIEKRTKHKIQYISIATSLDNLEVMNLVKPRHKSKKNTDVYISLTKKGKDLIKERNI